MRVHVLDENFAILRTLEAPADVAAFSKLWATQVKHTGEPAMRAMYKLDITDGRGTTRWLYDPAGLVRVLSKRHTAVYRLPTPTAFNDLLGLPPA